MLELVALTRRRAPLRTGADVDEDGGDVSAALADGEMSLSGLVRGGGSDLSLACGPIFPLSLSSLLLLSRIRIEGGTNRSGRPRLAPAVGLGLPVVDGTRARGEAASPTGAPRCLLPTLLPLGDDR